MRRCIAPFLLSLCVATGFAATVNFYVKQSGSNLNSGSTDDVAAIFTAVGDSDGTNIFTPSDGSTPASTISTGMVGSVYVTGATTTTFDGYITAVAAGVNGAVTFSTSTTAGKVGTFPSASAGAHTITMKVGGAWAGASGSNGFPYTFLTGALRPTTSDQARVYVKEETHAVTDPIGTPTGVHIPIIWEGYLTTPGDDLGGPTIDGGTGPTGYLLYKINSDFGVYRNFTWRHNGLTNPAGAYGTHNNGLTTFERCVWADMHGTGFYSGGAKTRVVESEAMGNNTSNGTNNYGMVFGADGSSLIRTYVHDNTGSNTGGVHWDGTPFMLGNIVVRNGKDGADTNGTNFMTVAGNLFMDNGRHGFFFVTGAGTLSTQVQNNMFLRNTGYAIGMTSPVNGRVEYNGWGLGSMANGLGEIQTTGALKGLSTNFFFGSGENPLLDYANNNYRNNSPKTVGTGAGNFLQSTTTPENLTVGYPDVGPVAARRTQVASGSSN